MSRVLPGFSLRSALAPLIVCLWARDGANRATLAAPAVASLVVETIATDSLLHGPDGVALDSSGNLYIANYDGGKGSTIVRVTPTGKASLFASGFHAPDGLTFDPRGNLYVSNFATGTIERIAPTGARTVFASGLDHPSSLALDRAGNLYVANFGNFDGTTVSRISPSGAVSTFASGFAAPLGLVFGPGGTLFVSNFASGVVHRVARDGTVAILATLNNTPRAMLQYLAFDDADALVVPSYGHNRVYRIAADGAVGVFAGNGTTGGVDGAADSASFDGPNSIVRAPAGEWYVTEYNTNRLRRIRARAGQPTMSAKRDSTWEDHDRAADSAAAHGDWRAFLHHVKTLDSALHGYPSVKVALARGYAQAGDPQRAMEILSDLAMSGVDRDVASDTLLRPLHAGADWKTVIAAFASNTRPMGRVEPVLTPADSALTLEDIAYDARRGRWLASSILRRSVVALGSDGSLRTVVSSTAANPLWSVSAVGVDSARDCLWLTTIANDRIPGLPRGARPRASILRVALSSGVVEHRFDLPDDGAPREPADLVVASNGDVIISDGRVGAVYLVSRRRDSLELLAPAGTFVAPQQPVVMPDGHTVLIPDYLLGIARIDRRGGPIRWLTHSPRMVVNGIDGMVLTGPRTLVAVQNGVRPVRILRLHVDAAFDAIDEARVLAQGDPITDPTHGAIARGAYYAIVRSGTNALAHDGTSATATGARLLPPIIARIELERDSVSHGSRPRH